MADVKVRQDRDTAVGSLLGCFTLDLLFDIAVYKHLFSGHKRKRWVDVKEWTSLPMPELLTLASRREDWKRISAESSLMPPRLPNR